MIWLVSADQVVYSLASRHMLHNLFRTINLSICSRQKTNLLKRSIDLSSKMRNWCSSANNRNVFMAPMLKSASMSACVFSTQMYGPTFSANWTRQHQQQHLNCSSIHVFRRWMPEMVTGHWSQLGGAALHAQITNVVKESKALTLWRPLLQYGYGRTGLGRHL